jgi:hypothetical protein
MIVLLFIQDLLGLGRNEPNDRRAARCDECSDEGGSRPDRIYKMNTIILSILFILFPPVSGIKVSQWPNEKE